LQQRGAELVAQETNRPWPAFHWGRWTAQQQLVQQFGSAALEANTEQ
jgi:hypothetical protein